LNTVAKKALELWQATDSPAGHTPADAVGFVVSDPYTSPLMPPEVVLPHRVATPEG
jgi:hypothetical protein